jgi:hypothetical protein
VFQTWRGPGQAQSNAIEAETKTVRKRFVRLLRKQERNFMDSDGPIGPAFIPMKERSSNENEESGSTRNGQYCQRAIEGLFIFQRNDIAEERCDGELEVRFVGSRSNPTFLMWVFWPHPGLDNVQETT